MGLGATKRADLMNKPQEAAAPQAGPKLLNLGCGRTWRPGWVNVDFRSDSPHVLAYDLRLGIPFADASFDVVYHSHVLEHFSKRQGEFFVRECFRVLRPGGLLRLAVPDLENIARAYLKTLEETRTGKEGAEKRHQWMLVEMLDQLTRTASGGEMLAWWREHPVPQREFIEIRLGEEARSGMESARHFRPAPAGRRPALEPANPEFSGSGELHRWMYDQVSLSGLLESAGFTRITRQTHDASLSAEPSIRELDSDAEGNVRKPDSLFMEAVKPQTPLPVPRVAMFSTSDAGGAAIAALRQHQALRDKGVSSEFYVMRQFFSREAVHVLPARGHHVASRGETAWHSALPACEYRHGQMISRFPDRPAGAEHFSFPAQGFSLRDVPGLADFDVLNLHWVAGMCDPALEPEAFAGRPLVWTLHDMNPFTGGCHYADGCRGFEKHCGSCPQLGSRDENDISRQTWKSRMTAYRKLNLHIVAPSVWLAEEARKSSLFSRFPVHVIPYAQPLSVYQPLNRDDLRAGLGMDKEELVLLFAAQSLGNRRKGGAFLLEMLQFLARTELKDRTTVLLLGGDPPRPFLETGVKAEATGHIDSDQHMAALYNAANAVLVPSLEDNQPNVVCEALGCGTPVVAFAAGGIPEMISHGETGFLAPTGDAKGLLEGVRWAAGAKENPAIRRLCRAFALKQWHPDLCAKSYMDLYQSLAPAR